MADIKIHRAHGMPIAAARKEAEKIARELKDKFDLAYEWADDRIVFQRQGVTGFMAVTKDAVAIEAKLGMLLSFLKPTIEGHINDNFDRVFSAAATKTSTRTAAKTTAKAPVKTAAKPATKGRKA